MLDMIIKRLIIKKWSKNYQNIIENTKLKKSKKYTTKV